MPLSVARGVMKSVLERRSVFSRFRDSFGQWNPRNQRPELWNLYNGKIRKGETIRVFPTPIGQSLIFGNTSSEKSFQ